MALESKDFLIMSVFFVFILAVGVMKVGADLRVEKDLDDASEKYLDKYSNDFNTNGMSELETDLEQLDKESNPILDKVGELPVISDVLGAINWAKEKTAFIWNFISAVFSIPTFLISTLGIDVGAFAIYLNIIGGVLFIAGLLVMFNLAK